MTLKKSFSDKSIRDYKSKHCMVAFILTDFAENAS